MWEQIKNTFRRNKMQKVVALISSTLLWFFVMDTQNPTIDGSYEVPLTMANIPQGYKPFYEEQNIQVKLSAPRSYFVDYSASNMRAFVNLQNFSAEGEYEIPVEVSYPKGFDLESISPNVVHVQLDPNIEKQMATNVIINGTLAADSVIKETTKSSENVTLIGAKSEVNRVTQVRGNVYLNGNSETFDIVVNLSAIDEDGREVRGVRVAPSAITVTVQISNEIRRKTVPVEADITFPEGREIEQIIVAPKAVEIIGNEEIINSIDSIKTESISFNVNAKTFIGNINKRKIFRHFFSTMRFTCSQNDGKRSELHHSADRHLDNINPPRNFIHRLKLSHICINIFGKRIKSTQKQAHKSKRAKQFIFHYHLP